MSNIFAVFPASESNWYEYGKKYTNPNIGTAVKRVPSYSSNWAKLGMRIGDKFGSAKPQVNIFKNNDLKLKEVGYKVPEEQKKAVLAAISSYDVSAPELLAPKKKGGAPKFDDDLKALLAEAEREHKYESKAQKKNRLAAIKAEYKASKKAGFKPAGNDAASEGSAEEEKSKAEESEGDTASESASETSEAEDKEASQNDIDEVAKALKKFHGEIGDPPYHLAKVVAEMEKANRSELYETAKKGLKLSVTRKLNKTQLIAILKNYMIGA